MGARTGSFTWKRNPSTLADINTFMWGYFIAFSHIGGYGLG